MNTQKRESGFNKRAGVFIKTLLQSLNTDSFVQLASLENEVVSTEVPEKVDQTVKILENMGYIQVTRGIDGAISAKLTNDGAVYAAGFFAEVK